MPWPRCPGARTSRRVRPTTTATRRSRRRTRRPRRIPTRGPPSTPATCRPTRPGTGPRCARPTGGRDEGRVVTDVEVTRAEVCAQAWRGDGEVMASPFGTVPQIGARLARLTFAPDLVLTDGEAALMANTPSVSSRRDELVLEAWMPYRRVFDVVWSGRRHI